MDFKLRLLSVINMRSKTLRYKFSNRHVVDPVAVYRLLFLNAIRTDGSTAGCIVTVDGTIHFIRALRFFRTDICIIVTNYVQRKYNAYTRNAASSRH